MDLAWQGLFINNPRVAKFEPLTLAYIYIHLKSLNNSGHGLGRARIDSEPFLSVPRSRVYFELKTAQIEASPAHDRRRARPEPTIGASQTRAHDRREPDPRPRSARARPEPKLGEIRAM